MNNFIEMLENFMKDPKNAELLQRGLAQMSDQAKNLTVSGSAGGGMVRVTFSGPLQLKEIKIDPLAVDKRDVEMLEQLIIAAFNDAYNKFKEQMPGT